MAGDVAVVGCGFAGLYVARLLTHEGIGVRCYERARRIPVYEHCTGIISKATLKRLKSFVDPEVLLEIRKFRLIFGAEEKEVKWPGKGYVINRLKLEKDLALGLEGKILLGHEVKKPEKLPQSTVVLATGAPFPSLAPWKPKTLPALQLDVKGVADTVEVHLGMNPDYFIWVVPYPGVLRIGTAGSGIKKLPHFARSYGKLLKAHGGAIVTSGPLKKLFFRADGKTLFLFGDAAGLVKPFTGGGLAYSTAAGKWLVEAITEENPEIYQKKVHKNLGVEILLQKIARFLLRHRPGVLYELADFLGYAEMDYLGRSFLRPFLIPKLLLSSYKVLKRLFAPL